MNTNTLCKLEAIENFLRTFSASGPRSETNESHGTSLKTSSLDWDDNNTSVDSLFLQKK